MNLTAEFQLLEAAVLRDVEAVQHYDSCCDARPEHMCVESRQGQVASV
jgi:hypothetical protein